MLLRKVASLRRARGAGVPAAAPPPAEKAAPVRRQRGPKRDADGNLVPGVAPDFLIIGAMKAGTTSLFLWLRRHPLVATTRPKEIHFFDYEDRYRLGPDWYLAHFPAGRPQRRWVAGEATPSYLALPRVPARAAEVAPDAKLVVLLRDPVERARSHWGHQRRLGMETSAWDDVVAWELSGADMEAAPPSNAPRRRRDRYVERGLYAEQLDRWWRHYDRDATLVLHSADLFARPADTLARVQGFLGLPVVPPPQLKPHNVGSYDAMSPATAARLREYYAPHNERLFALLGEDYGWNG